MPQTVLLPLIFALSALFAQADQTGVTTDKSVEKIVVPSQDDGQTKDDDTQEDNVTDKTPPKSE